MRSRGLVITTATHNVIQVFAIIAAHDVIQLSLNSGFVQVPNLLTTCRKFAKAKISDSGPNWKQDFRLSSVNHATKTIHHHHHERVIIIVVSG